MCVLIWVFKWMYHLMTMGKMGENTERLLVLKVETFIKIIQIIWQEDSCEKRKLTHHQRKLEPKTKNNILSSMKRKQIYCKEEEFTARQCLVLSSRFFFTVFADESQERTKILLVTSTSSFTVLSNILCICFEIIPLWFRLPMFYDSWHLLNLVAEISLYLSPDYVEKYFIYCRIIPSGMTMTG